MLGKTGGIAVPLDRTVFGVGSGDIWMDDVTCTGSESDIKKCNHITGPIHTCNHQEDAAVICAG